MTSLARRRYLQNLEETQRARAQTHGACDSVPLLPRKDCKFFDGTAVRLSKSCFQLRINGFIAFCAAFSKKESQNNRRFPYFTPSRRLNQPDSRRFLPFSQARGEPKTIMEMQISCQVPPMCFHASNQSMPVIQAVKIIPLRSKY